MFRPRLAFSFVAAAFLAPQSGLAQAPAGLTGATRLDYTRSAGAEACPDADAWRDLVVARIEGAKDPFTTAGPHVLRVTMERRTEDYRAALEVLDAAGRSRGLQEQTALTCPQAARALAVDASLLFVAPLSPPSQPATVPSVGVRAPVVQPVPPAPPSPPPPARRRWRVQLGLGGGAAAGFAPFIAPSFGGFAGIRVPVGPADDGPSFAISLEGRADLEASGGRVAGPQGQEGQVTTSWAGGTLAPCGHSTRFFFGCLLLTAGEARSRLGEQAEPASQGALFMGLGGRAGVEIPLLRGRPVLAARISLDGWIALVRPGVRVDGTVIWTAPQGAGTLGAYLVTLF